MRPPWAMAEGGGHLLAIGVKSDVSGVCRSRGHEPAEHIAASFEPFGLASALVGWDRRIPQPGSAGACPLVTAGAAVVGNGVWPRPKGNVVFCQLAPWQLDYRKQNNVKRTYRREAS